MAKAPQQDRIHALEDELKAAKARIEELRQECDKAQDSENRMRDRLEDNRAVIESWIEAFDMQLGDDGKWCWHANLADRYDALLERYRVLVKHWNKMLAVWAPQDVGRPLGASEAQCAAVLKLRKKGTPYRLIMDETGLSLQTVRTIIGREQRTDRTTKKRLQRLGVDKTELIRAKARKRTRDALPQRFDEALTESAELIAESKGLGRVRS